MGGAVVFCPVSDGTSGQPAFNSRNPQFPDACKGNSGILSDTERTECGTAPVCVRAAVLRATTRYCQTSCGGRVTLCAPKAKDTGAEGYVVKASV